MASEISDETFARLAVEAGLVAPEQIETARRSQAVSTQKGVALSLADVLLLEDVITLATRERIEALALPARGGVGSTAVVAPGERKVGVGTLAALAAMVVGLGFLGIVAGVLLYRTSPPSPPPPVVTVSVSKPGGAEQPVDGTLSPAAQPETANLKPETKPVVVQPETVDLKPETPSPKSQIPNPQSKIQNPKSEIQNSDTPTLPADVAPLSAALNAQIKQLMQSVEEYRGLPCKRPVPCGSVERGLLKKKMLQVMQEELPPEKMNSLQAGLKAFGFIPESMNLGQYFPELLTSQVGGYYDPRRKYLALVQSPDGGVGVAGMEQTVLVHELTHAVQDQHFDLEKFVTNEVLSDEDAAHTALVEGDATLTMYDYSLGMRLEKMPGADMLLAQMLKDPQQLIAMTRNMPGGKEMNEAPAWIRDNLLFGYMQGMMFCVSVRKLGGRKLLDYAFTTDPPRSTEQIMHPEKWHTQRDDPVAISWPDLSRELPGYKKVCEGQLGELSMKTLLREALKDEKRAAIAAAGWGGDRCAVYQKGAERVMLWITEWDSVLDGKEFKEAAAALGPDWKLLASRPTRVQVVRGTLEPAALAAVHARLAEARSEVPANKNIDLAALGVEKGGDAEAGADLAKALAGVLDGKDGDLDLAKLLNDPAMKKRVEKLAGEQGGLQPGEVERPDLGKMLEDPQVQNMMKNMLSQQVPGGTLSQDGRTYVNETLGYKLSLPPSRKDWKLDAKPPPPASVMVLGSGGSVQISVASQRLPMAIPASNLGPMLEMASQVVVENYKKLSGTEVETSGKKGYELQYEGEMAGQRVRSTHRAYADGGGMIMVQAIAPADDWARNEKAIKETLDSFSFIEPSVPKKAPPPKKEPQEE
ncbi:MAG: hypothetical protein NTW87_19020 [Planctomycetota bacterium]|nr:hypothetical protein [Planctomycetota bacterium]